jgi:hypothetical protein
LKRLLDSLLAIKATMRDTAEPCVKEHLDEVIDQIRALKKRDDTYEDAQAKALIFLDGFLKRLPSIAVMIDKFLSN